MRIALCIALLSVSVHGYGNSLQEAIEELRSGDISLETIAALVTLDAKPLGVGYGLCEAAGQPLCKPDGSVGYGLCEVADGPLCKEDGSVGYGLCMLSGSRICRANGSVGYGLCMLAGEKNCMP